jgi:hypothetical protein
MCDSCSGLTEEGMLVAAMTGDIEDAWSNTGTSGTYN